MVQLLEVQARGAPARDAERLARADTQYARDTDRDEHTVERASEAVFRFSLSGGRGFDGASALTSCLMCLTSAIVDRINRFAFGVFWGGAFLGSICTNTFMLYQFSLF